MGKIALAVIVSLWAIPITILVNHIVPEPYMDEIFHIPQAQKYCKGDFGSWDPMITTPPGLYCLSLAHAASLFPGFYSVQAASSLEDLCSTAILRSLNCVFAINLFYLFACMPTKFKAIIYISVWNYVQETQFYRLPDSLILCEFKYLFLFSCLSPVQMNPYVSFSCMPRWLHIINI